MWQGGHYDDACCSHVYASMTPGCRSHSHSTHSHMPFADWSNVTTIHIGRMFFSLLVPTLRDKRTVQEKTINSTWHFIRTRQSEKNTLTHTRTLARHSASSQLVLSSAPAATTTPTTTVKTPAAATQHTPHTAGRHVINACAVLTFTFSLRVCARTRTYFRIFTGAPNCAASTSAKPIHPPSPRDLRDAQLEACVLAPAFVGVSAARLRPSRMLHGATVVGRRSSSLYSDCSAVDTHRSGMDAMAFSLSLSCVRVLALRSLALALTPRKLAAETREARAFAGGATCTPVYATR